MFAAVVGDDVADLQMLPTRLDPSGRSSSGGNEPFHPAWQVPPGATFAELDQPRPHRRRLGGQRERAVHHDIGRVDQVVAGPGRAALVGGGGNAREHRYSVSSALGAVVTPS